MDAANGKRPMAPQITALLHAWQQGEQQAAAELAEVVYPRLREIAARRLELENGPISVQATEVVHEAYLQLAGLKRIDWQNRDQFFAISASLMRRILVDRARRRNSLKRGGPTPRASEPLDELGAEGLDLDVLALHDALDRLAAVDPSASRLVELRYFGGLSIGEAAGVLGMSRATAVRRWQFARGWLRRALTSPRPTAPVVL